MNNRLLAGAVVCLCVAVAARAGEPAKAEGKAQLPNLRLDLKTKTIEIDGTFCVGEYPLELLACQGTLRDYESMVSSPCKPSILHAALLALGLKPRIRDKEDPGKILREGDPIDIRIRFAKDGQSRTVEPRELIIDLQTKKHIKATPFVFYGSFLFPDPADKKRMIYLADSEQWLVGVLGDTASVIDMPREHAGTYGNLAIDLKVAPAQGAKATLIIRPARRPKPGKAK